MATPHRSTPHHPRPDTFGEFGRQKFGVGRPRPDAGAVGIFSTGHPRCSDSERAKAQQKSEDVRLLDDLVRNLITEDSDILCRALIRRYQSLPAVLQRFRKFDPNDDEIPAAVGYLLSTLSHLIRRTTRQEALDGPVSIGSKSFQAWLHCEMAHLPRETFLVLFLDTKNRLLADEFLWEGTTDCVQIYPREVIRRAIDNNASALIFVHNHPSGDPSPSKNDILLNNKLIMACSSVNIFVRDHIIISRSGWFSMVKNCIFDVDGFQ